MSAYAVRRYASYILLVSCTQAGFDLKAGEFNSDCTAYAQAASVKAMAGIFGPADKSSKNNTLNVAGVYVAETLVKDLAIQGINIARNTAGTATLQSRLLNCTGESLAVQIRTSFLKENSLPSEPQSAWRRTILAPHGTYFYEEKSLSTEASTFLVEFAELN